MVLILISFVGRAFINDVKANDNFIFLSVTPKQVNTKVLLSFGFPEPRNDFDKGKMINRYKQWRTYFNL